MSKLPKIIYIRPYDLDTNLFSARKKPEHIAVAGKTIEAGEYILKRKVKIRSQVTVAGE